MRFTFLINSVLLSCKSTTHQNLSFYEVWVIRSETLRHHTAEGVTSHNDVFAVEANLG